MSRNAYIVCAGAERGAAVIVGYADEEPRPGAPCRIKQARMILSWSGGQGLFALANQGPGEGSRLTQAVPWTSCRAQEVLPVADAAMAKIASWPSV